MATKDNVKEKHQGWVVSLSNGETVFQTPDIEGERSAWGKLIDRCDEEGLWITQLQLQLYGRTIAGIKGADGYTSFTDYRQEGIVGSGTRIVRHKGIGSVVGDTVICTLLNDEGQTWQDSRPLASMLAHCVLKPAS